MSDPAADATPKRSNLAQRLLTALVVIPGLLLLLFVAPPWGFLVLLAIATAIGANELFGMTLPNARPLQSWGLLASLGLYAAMVLSVDPRTPSLAITALVLGGVGVSLLYPEPIEGAAARLAWLIAGPMYIGGLLGALGLLFSRPNGGGWALLAMMLAWLADTGGYFTGRAFGKRRLAPRISPGKTVEGAAGGILGSIAGALLAHFWYLPALSLGGALALGVVAGALGQVGDLGISLIKRSRRIKDSGWIIPGHGGMLDRIDALLFTSAMAWVYAEWLLG